MGEGDDILHQKLRLQIMAALNAAQGQPVEFAQLKRTTQATDGNLGSHLTTLEKAGYVKIVKDFAGKRPRTRAGLTAAGRRAFRAHVDYLREIVEGAEPD